MTLSYVTDASTLATCALVSLTFHHLLIPLLYHTVCLKGISWDVDILAIFLHGILAPTADEGAMQRKRVYLRHLKVLILYDNPRCHQILAQPQDSKGLFPSLRYIEFRHDNAPKYSWLFSQFSDIQHVCIRTYESYKMDLSSCLAKWTNVISLTLHNYYASDLSIRSLNEGDGIPLSWQKLREITVYPELASHGVILLIRPYHTIPNPFAFMPNPGQFPLLQSFTIVIPKESQYDRRRYEKYVLSVREEQRDMIRIVVGETKNIHEWVWFSLECLTRSFKAD